MTGSVIVPAGEASVSTGEVLPDVSTPTANASGNASNGAVGSWPALAALAGVTAVEREGEADGQNA